MEKQSKQLKVWRAVGISAIVALVIVSTLLVVSTTRKNPVKSDLAGEDGMLFSESGINTDANPDSTSSSAPDWIRSDVRISYLGPAGTYTEEAAVFFLMVQMIFFRRKQLMMLSHLYRKEKLTMR